MRTAIRLLPLFVVMVAATGCGTNIKPKGRLVSNGQPYKPADGAAVHMSFISMKEGKTPGGAYPAEFNREDGTFRVVGSDLNGLPPGKYRIAIQVIDKKKDLLGGAYGADNSPLVRDVVGASEEIVVDLSNPTG